MAATITSRRTSRVRSIYESTAAVVGQEKARRQLAVLLDHQMAVAEGAGERSPAALMCGVTGSGKSMLVRTACLGPALNLPFADANATQYTEAGYTGFDLAQMFIPLVEDAARIYDGQREPEWEVRGFTRTEKSFEAPSSVFERDGDELREIISLAQTGVLLLDEFDKWMARVNHATGQRDTAIQGELLKMVEGSLVYLRYDDEAAPVAFDTSKVLVICAGAFVGLAEAVRRRLHREEEDAKALINNPSFWDLIEPGDFIRFGVIPELAGRLSTHIFLRPLTDMTLLKILEEPDGVLTDYQARFEALGVEWDVRPEGVRLLAGEAFHREMGARAIQHVMWTYFSEALFEAALAQERMRVTLAVNSHRAILEPV